MKKHLWHLLTLVILLGSLAASSPATSQGMKEQDSELVYLPMLMKGSPAQHLPRINVPDFGSQPIAFSETAIAWFGKLSADTNYTDIRVGYNNQQLYVYLAIFDRHLWYSENPTESSLTEWDAATMLIDTAASTNLSSSSYRFVAQLSNEEDPRYQAGYRGGSAGWQATTLSFSAQPGWRGNALNDDTDSDRGWAMGFTIPFSSFGLAAAPPHGATWRMAVMVHDRDSHNGPPFVTQSWPPDASLLDPSSWGFLSFGIPAHASPLPANDQTIIRRPTQDSPLVPDADVGGAIANQCPGDENHIWNEWANRNYGTAPDFNIQNQADIADWPCFARYYVTFPLDSIPANKTIVSARLILHQFGNAGNSGKAIPSYIQVLTALGDWQEASITWNNAPLAYENFGGSWVQPLSSAPDWPGVARSWDVSLAVVKAYQSGQPLRLILYSADSDYHSGKYFVSSDTGDWNAEGRPTLEVKWSN